MVSIQDSISSNQRSMISHVVSPPNKRKWLDSITQEEEATAAQSRTSIYDINFSLQAPLPLDWKQCLDLQSGEVHYYNTKTRKTTYKDPRESPKRSKSGDTHHMSLDLELNLLPKVDDDDNDDDEDEPDSRLSLNSSISNNSPKKKNSESMLKQCTSWASFDDDHKEMVAAACMRCHMLVMLNKSSPACPNCKFMHLPHQTPKALFS